MASEKTRISPRAGLIYRLSGDRNPLHVDPKTAAEAGFDRPILHGLCTYAMATYAVIREFASSDVERLASVGVRFKTPVFPGETLRTSIWRDGSRLQLVTTVDERDGATALSDAELVIA